MSLIVRTYSGNEVDLNAPHPDSITLVDIAHALSMMPVLGGHGCFWYPIALSCVHASQVVIGAGDALSALMARAYQAYVGPLTPTLTRGPLAIEYDIIAETVQAAIAAKFGLMLASDEVRRAHTTAEATEVRDLTGNKSFGHGYADPQYVIDGKKPRTPRLAFEAFMSRFDECQVFSSQMSLL